MPRHSGVRPFRPVIASFIATAVAVAALGHASAASGTSEPTTPDDFASQLDGIGDVSLTMWQHSYPPLNDWTENQIAAFEAEHPSIDVTFELVPFEEYNQKILTALAAGEGPQVFESDDYTFAQFTENGVLAPIDPAALGFDSVADLTAGYTANSLALVTAEDGTVSGHPLRPRGSGRELQHRTPRRRRRRPGEPHDMGCGDGSCGDDDGPRR